MQRPPPPLSRWMEGWLVSSSVFCFMDIAYVFARPHSQRDGRLGTVFYFWNLYADVDLRYKEEENEVLRSSERLMVVEILLNLLVVFFNRRRSPHSKLAAFMTSAFTFWKTTQYLMMYVWVPADVVHFLNPAVPVWKHVLLFWLPNSVWFFVPLLMMKALWMRLVPPSPANLLRANKPRAPDERPAGTASNLLTGQ
ncbi:hypothetical protein M3Y99_01571800 [Aphelenchoides fujianensis]|nr:hypothetical protein M3Y99_01571800 [Aphelenchoides fujianensis]